MHVFAALIMGLIVYVGSNFLMTNVVTGTTTGVVVLNSILPIVLALAAVGIIIKVFV